MDGPAGLPGDRRWNAPAAADAGDAPWPDRRARGRPAPRWQSRSSRRRPGRRHHRLAGRPAHRRGRRPPALARRRPRGSVDRRDAGARWEARRDRPHPDRAAGLVRRSSGVRGPRAAARERFSSRRNSSLCCWRDVLATSDSPSILARPIPGSLRTLASRNLARTPDPTIRRTDLLHRSTRGQGRGRRRRPPRLEQPQRGGSPRPGQRRPGRASGSGHQKACHRRRSHASINSAAWPKRAPMLDDPDPRPFHESASLRLATGDETRSSGIFSGGNSRRCRPSNLADRKLGFQPRSGPSRNGALRRARRARAGDPNADA